MQIMMKNFSRSFISLLLIFLVALPATAFADAASAQVFYENAAKEYGKGNYGQAAELLYKAYVNDANLIYAYNRILALQADKQYTAALKELNVFENQMMKDPDKRFEDVPQIKTKLEDQVKAAAAAKVKDPIVKDPVIKDPVVKDPDVKDPDNTVQPIPETGLNSMEILGLTIAGAGIPVLVVGILFSTGITVSDEVDRVQEVKDSNESLNDAIDIAYTEQECSPSTSDEIENTCRDQYFDEKDDIIPGELDTAVPLIIAGGALIIGGGILYLVSGDSPAEADASASNFTIAPYITPTGAGAGFSLDF